MKIKDLVICIYQGKVIFFLQDTTYFFRGMYHRKQRCLSEYLLHEELRLDVNTKIRA